ncbi:hypothetical protein PTTG_10435 [Puccinia triticina 1-1 BBBD Race 1]|uniref:Uncharacterized protein n=1 Tax=Puccinia triticina (isolate 1-1 / race 1 (BBBD)) TaxID=630390 RepID=A0A0C4FB41_PUCT1|nr:hypothetical protein PTTG_10435 [Puccinia triticina 1-1 BBBD Race 1]
MEGASQLLVQNLSANLSDDQVIKTFRIYLSRQDLRKMTKRSDRDALNYCVAWINTTQAVAPPPILFQVSEAAIQPAATHHTGSVRFLPADVRLATNFFHILTHPQAIVNQQVAAIISLPPTLLAKLARTPDIDVQQWNIEQEHCLEIFLVMALSAPKPSPLPRCPVVPAISSTTIGSMTDSIWRGLATKEDY